VKIAILAASAHPGGAERVTINLANEFAERGHEVDLVLAQAKGDMLLDVSPRVRIVDLAATRARSAVMPFRRYILSRIPDAILAITFEMNLTAALAVTGLRRRPRLLLSVHGPLVRLKAAGRIWRTIVGAVSKRAYPTADYVVGVSDGVAADLVNAGWVDPDRVRKVYNPVVSRDFATKAAQDLPPNVVRDPGVPTIVTVGRLSPEKNQLLLLEAVKIVTQKRPVHLSIVGEGPSRGDLEHAINRLGLAGCVQLTGYVANPLPIVRSADLFVLTSNREGFGNVIVEAMAVGTPVISTDCPHGPRDILGGGKWGTLVPTDDANALAGAILSALDSGGIDARDRARDFTVEAAADGYLALMT
jgi:glycosyltransferase involved in cell wall biosynthesis